MTNHITDLLNLKDSDIQIKSISTHGNIKEITFTNFLVSILLNELHMISIRYESNILTIMFVCINKSCLSCFLSYFIFSIFS